MDFQLTNKILREWIRDINKETESIMNELNPRFCTCDYLEDHQICNHIIDNKGYRGIDPKPSLTFLSVPPSFEADDFDLLNQPVPKCYKERKI